MAAPLLSVCLFALQASFKLCNRRHCPFVALILIISLPFLNAVALFHSDFSFLFSMTMSLTTCPVSVIGHLSTLPLHAHYAIHLPFAFHALAHPCFCPLLSTSLLLPTTLLLASELNSCLSLLPPSGRRFVREEVRIWRQSRGLESLCLPICITAFML